MTQAIINEAVPKTSEDYILLPEEAYGLTFEKRVTVQGEIKIARATVHIGHKQFMEIVEKYGFKLGTKWQTWDSSQKRRVQYVEK